jgi:hypothetical protein
VLYSNKTLSGKVNKMKDETFFDLNESNEHEFYQILNVKYKTCLWSTQRSDFRGFFFNFSFYIISFHRIDSHMKTLTTQQLIEHRIQERIMIQNSDEKLFQELLEWGIKLLKSSFFFLNFYSQGDHDDVLWTVEELGTNWKMMKI